MLRPSPNHGTQRLPNDDGDDESLNNKSTSTGMSNNKTFKWFQNNCGSSLKLYLVSKPESVLGQTKTNAMEGFIGTIAVGGRENLKISR